MTEAVPVVSNEYAELFPGGWSEAVGETLVAFANTQGGDLYFGAEEGGLRSDHAVRRIWFAVSRFAREEVEPPMPNLLSWCEIPGKCGAFILKVTVAPGPDVPYAFRGKLFTGGCLLREGTENVPATEREILRMTRESIPTPWEMLPCGRWDVSFRQAKKLFQEGGVPFFQKRFERLGLTNNRDEYTNLARLISDENPALIVFKFRTEETISKSDDWKFPGSILHQIDNGIGLFERSSFLRFSGGVDEALGGWPDRVLRAALIVCSVHRDYTIPEPMTVTFYRDRAVFEARGCSLGNFAREGGVIDFAANCRDFQLSAILMELDWTKDEDLMFSSIPDAYAGTGLVPKLELTRRTVRIVLPRLPKVGEAKKSDVERGRELFEGFDNLSTTDIMQRLEVSRAIASKIVKALMQEGVIEKTGIGRSTRYLRVKSGAKKDGEAGASGAAA